MTLLETVAFWAAVLAVGLWLLGGLVLLAVFVAAKRLDRRAR